MSEGESIVEDRLEKILHDVDALILLAKSFTLYEEKAQGSTEPRATPSKPNDPPKLEQSYYRTAGRADT
jgi:D-Tyr-tRNAtyr deacylase